MNSYFFFSTGKWHHISGRTSMALHRLVTHSSFSSPACGNGVNTPQPFKTKKKFCIQKCMGFSKQSENYQENRSFERLGDYFLLNSTHYLVVQVICFVTFWHTRNSKRLHFTRASGTSQLVIDWWIVEGLCFSGLHNAFLKRSSTEVSRFH